VSSRRVFLTGGSGFVGRTLLRELSRIDGLEVVALDRSGSLASKPADPRISVVRGNLLEPQSYARELSGCDCVIHLAAATGKASPDVHTRDTAVATEVLLDACRAAGVERFLLVSSIAAAFQDKRGYPYAEAKHRAERAVAASGLRYSVLRPTMIFGEGAPVQASLTALAMLPLVVVPGSGNVRVQPISVDDVVKAIISILQTDRFQSETFEVGGPEILTMGELLQRVRVARKGARGPTVRIPLGLIQTPLAVAEGIGLRAVLPATAGQFSSFRHDGVATPNALQQALAPGMDPVDSMIGATGAIGATTDPIESECIVFTRHLLGVRPDPAVIEKYGAALASLPALQPSSAWDRALLAMARRGVAGARCADAFAALFARASVLRKRLVILLAILETRAPYSDAIDSALGGPALLVIARVAWRGVWSLVWLVVGAALLVPVRIALSLRGEPAR
jgi:nucleoside-diphosphate-sugar epimerase